MQEQVLNSISKEEAVQSGLAYSSLVSAIFRGNDALNKVIVSRTGMDLDSQGATGNTALMFAALWNKLSTVEYLLGAGASVNLTNNKGETALNLARNAGNKAVVTLLRSHGAL